MTASVSKKLLSQAGRKWRAGRKSSFTETVIFRLRTHLRTLALSEQSRPGGAAKILPPQRQKGAPTHRFWWGAQPRTPSRLSWDTNVARPAALKPSFRDFRVREKIPVKTGVLKGLVARSARRCAAVDTGGFSGAFSGAIAPLLPDVRASSQD